MHEKNSAAWPESPRSHILKIAAVQINIRLMDVRANLQTILDRMEEAVRNNADLIVFPECALSGYCFDTREEAILHAEPVPGASTEALGRAASKLGCSAVIGILERDGDQLYNTAVVIEPGGLAGSYRKLHLPYLGVDRFVTPGDKGFPVFEVGRARVAINICYDCSFPEACRIPKLEGAQILVIPTNWPVSSDSWLHVPSVRAIENHMIVAAADRVGDERGVHFAGHSQIIDFTGASLAEAGELEETILYAEVDSAAADRNRVARIPGKYEIDRIADRRPELYRLIGQPVASKKRADSSPR
jgi:5-aminopentanamidase